MMKVFLIAGARPNFMKIAPIYRASLADSEPACHCTFNRYLAVVIIFIAVILKSFQHRIGTAGKYSEFLFGNILHLIFQ